jgi:hypothetical protein
MTGKGRGDTYMNIYSFLRSPDVAVHCERIGHRFNSLEMAVIVTLSRKTIKEKHAAWREILTDYPDMPVHGSLNFRARESLHAFLREQIAWEEEWLAAFRTPGERSVYRPCIAYARHSRKDDMGCYSSMEKAQTEIRDYSDDWEEDKISHAAIRKEDIDGDYGRKDVWIDSAGEILNFSGRLDGPGELDMIFIHIPLPFEKGDIVEFVREEGKPCVLIGLPHWSYRGLCYADRISGKRGDGSDMIAWVYFMDEDGRLSFNDGPYFFYDLKYFHGELRGPARFLEFLSDYIKNLDKEDINSLLYAFDKIKAQVESVDRNTLHDLNFQWWRQSLEQKNAENPVRADVYGAKQLSFGYDNP